MPGYLAVRPSFAPAPALVVAWLVTLPSDGSGQESFGIAGGAWEACTLEWLAGPVEAGPTGLQTFGTRLIPGGERWNDEPLMTSLGERPLVLGAGFESFHGPVRAGRLVEVRSGDLPTYEYTGPSAPTDGGAAPRIGLTLMGKKLAASFQLMPLLGAPAVRKASVGFDLGSAYAVFGTVTPRTGPRCEQGIVLAGGAGTVWGVELAGHEGWRARGLGRVHLGVQLGTLAEAGPGNRRPVFHAMRIEVRPSPSVRVGLNRAMLFGGSASDVPITARTLAFALAGLTDVEGKDSDFENQVASVDVTVRGRIGGRPFVADVEYGADDSGLAFRYVPGVRAGIALGVREGTWLGIDAAGFAPRTRSYPPWYRHGGLSWGWSDRGVLLGNDLGGEGWAVLPTVWFHKPGALVTLSAGIASRGKDNLFAPDLEGLGGRLRGSLVVVKGGWELRADARVEGMGVWASTVSAWLSYRFDPFSTPTEDDLPSP